MQASPLLSVVCCSACYQFIVLPSPEIFYVDEKLIDLCVLRNRYQVSIIETIVEILDLIKMATGIVLSAMDANTPEHAKAIGKALGLAVGE